MKCLIFVVFVLAPFYLFSQKSKVISLGVSDYSLECTKVKSSEEKGLLLTHRESLDYYKYKIEMKVNAPAVLSLSAQALNRYSAYGGDISQAINVKFNLFISKRTDDKATLIAKNKLIDWSDTTYTNEIHHWFKIPRDTNVFKEIAYDLQLDSSDFFNSYANSADSLIVVESKYALMAAHQPHGNGRFAIAFTPKGHAIKIEVMEIEYLNESDKRFHDVNGVALAILRSFKLNIGDYQSYSTY